MKISLTTRDLINIAVFSVVYFVLMYATGMVGFFGPAFMFVGWIIGIVLNGVVTMLLLARVPKIGALTLLGLLVGIGMVPGHTIWILVAAPLIGFGADLIARAGAQNQPLEPARAIAAFSFLQLWMIIPLLPIVINADSYYRTIEPVMGADYTAAMRALFTPTVIGIWAVCLLVIGAAGGWVGLRVAKKHFHRAGLTS